jgi:hypothetical protein
MPNRKPGITPPIAGPSSAATEMLCEIACSDTVRSSTISRPTACPKCKVCTQLMPQCLTLATERRRTYIVVMAYDPDLPGCFSERDLALAAHSLDKQRAFAWLVMLHQRQTTWSEVKTQIEDFLRERGAPPFLILDQIDRAEVLFKPWLYGPDNDE